METLASNQEKREVMHFFSVLAVIVSVLLVVVACYAIAYFVADIILGMIRHIDLAVSKVLGI